MRLVYVALAWTAGIVLAANNSSGSPVVVLVWLGLSVVSALLFLTDRHIGTVALLAFTLGGLRMIVVPVTSDIAQYNNSGGLTIEGRVVAEPDIRDDRSQIQVDAETVTRAGQTTTTSGRVLVQVPRSTDVRYGDRLQATGLLITPGEFDTFSYADYLARSGVFSIMRQSSVELLSRENSLYGALLDLKAQAAQHIGQHLPDPQAALLTGIVLGLENGISPSVEEDFSRVGASHVIAISGFNMVILAGVVQGITTQIGLSNRRVAVLSIAVVAIYTLFVGANAAVIRAAVMSSVWIIGTSIRRKTYVVASLAFVAIAMSAINPAVLWDVSFQLSLFATLGLALYTAPLSRAFDRVLARIGSRSLAQSLGNFLLEPVIVTLAAQITTLPLILVYFNRLSSIALLTNLLIVPVQAWLLILGIIATIIAFILPPLAKVLFWLDMILLSWTIWVVQRLADLPFADVEFHVDPRLIFIYYAILIGAAMMQATQPTWALRLGQLIRRRAVTSAVLFAGIATLLLTAAVLFSRPDEKLHVWLLNVGHSNAVLIQSPGGAQILVDGGRFPSRLLTALGERLPFYDQSIETLALTQLDENEFSALSAVLNRYDVGVVLTNGQPNQSPAYIALEDQIAGRDMLTVSSGYQLEIDDGVRIEVLHPTEPPELSDNLDDGALVLRVSYGEVSFLLTGDLSPEGQQALLESGAWPVSTVLQIPRHGGSRALDEAFLAAVQPQLAILQADPTNRRGDPDPDTLALLGDITVYMSEDQGALHLWTDGVELWLQNEA